MDITSTQGVIDIAIQSVAFCLLCYSLWMVCSQLQHSARRFWVASFIGLLCMAPVPLFGITLTLLSFTTQSQFSFPTYVALIGDVLLRLGCIVLTLCRFQRVRRVCQLPKRWSTALLYSASGAVVAAMAVNLWSDVSLRLQRAQDGAANVLTLPVEEWLDRTVAFASFVVVNGANLATDIIFFAVLFRSASPPRPTRAQLAQGLSTTISLLYLALQTVAVAAPWVPNMTYASIALNRFVPAVDAFVFYAFIVFRTRRIVEANAVTDLPASASSSKPAPAARQDRIHSIVTRTTRLAPPVYTGASPKSWAVFEHRLWGPAEEQEPDQDS
ncbi:hypothetical protein RI367_005231 [Sorochytrium milnesiophthora]